jgi:hypothetical protein
MDLTLRDKIKIDCLNYAVSQGLSEDEMTTLFTKAAAYVREHGIPKKEAGIATPLPSWMEVVLGLGLVGPPLLTSRLAAGVGNQAGQTLKNMEIGQVPDADEIRLADEIGEYERNADEIMQRIADRKRREKLLSKPSVRRMF